ncbi:MAG: sigma-54 dependent transcriptional regulator, partial [Planctomycetota bacterium]
MTDPPSADRPLDLLLVEDDPDFREMAGHFLSRSGHRVSQAADGSEALEAARRSEFDIAVVDMNMPGLTGLEVLDRLRDLQPLLEVLILTGQGTVETAVQAMKLGACDYLTKPFPLPDLEHRCRLAAGRRQIRKENTQLKALLARGRTSTAVIAESPPMRRVMELVDRVAKTDHTALITGESGTGKEVVAKAIHERSPRSLKPLVTINCAALPEQLVESELFGHVKGAFTGATAEQPGLFEVADGGTMLIDELGELPPALQPKLLRVLEDGSLRRVGSSTERRVDVRVIAATNRDLAAEVAAGRFREDLYYRINVLTVHLPPLRERGGDLWRLVESKLAGRAELDPDARALIAGYGWPGNVRQLLNAL